MERNDIVRQAIYNMGGPKMAGHTLNVSTSTIGKWIRKGVIPKLANAKRVAEESGFDLALLRPPYKQEHG